MSPLRQTGLVRCACTVNASLLQACKDAESQIRYLRDRLSSKARAFTSPSTDSTLYHLRDAINVATKKHKE